MIPGVYREPYHLLYIATEANEPESMKLHAGILFMTYLRFFVIIIILDSVPEVWLRINVT